VAGPVVYHVKLLLAGIAESLVFRVSREESQRIRATLDMGGARFIVFETTEKDMVAFSVGDIQAANFLFDLGTFDHERGEARIVVHLRGRTEPFFTTTDGAEEELAQAFRDLEVEEREFIHFTDEDGEDLVLRCDQIVCIVVPRRLLITNEPVDLHAVDETDDDGPPSESA